MRRIAFALALAVSWTIVLLWAARVDWGSPFAPAEQREFPGNDFNVVFGNGSADGDRLHVAATGESFTSLQSLAPSELDAENFPTLRYRFADFPRTLELSLIFRSADSPEDVAISLPWPGDAMQTFDLSRIPEWRGRIVEIGFAEFPTAQLVPPAQGFKPFDLVEAGLESRSWRGDVAALATDWLGDWPWTQRSVHALGRDTDTPRARSLVLCVAIATGVALVWVAVLFRRRDREFAIGGAVVVVALAWLALDVAWQSGLWGRLKTTRAVYADLSWLQRERAIADVDIAHAAESARVMLRAEPPEARILVYADPQRGYELLRFIWHMLPRNVAVFAYALPFAAAIPDGCLIVFYETDVWHTDPKWRTFLARSRRVTASGSIHRDSFESSPVAVFRYRHGP
jgi:hypothetical protein